MSAHAALRAATADAHDAIDASFADYDLGDEAQYRAFLVRHAAAFIPAERALSAAGAARLIPDWDDLRRSDLLIADLDDLGAGLPSPRRAPGFDDDADILGGAYVLEGSRLGSDVLRRAVAPGLPRRFLDAVQPKGRWRAFITLLDRALYRRDALDRAIASALGTFALFAQGGREDEP